MSGHLRRPAESAAVVAQIFGTRSISARTLKVSNVCHLRRAHANFPISTRDAKLTSLGRRRRSISPIISPGVVRSQVVYADDAAESRAQWLDLDPFKRRETSQACCSKGTKKMHTMLLEIAIYFITPYWMYSYFIFYKIILMRSAVCMLYETTTWFACKICQTVKKKVQFWHVKKNGGKFWNKVMVTSPYWNPNLEGNIQGRMSE